MNFKIIIKSYFPE